MIDRLTRKLLGFGTATGGAVRTLPDKSTREGPPQTVLPTHEQFRGKIEAHIRRSGINGDPLEHSYRALLEIVEVQLTLKAETERLVDQARVAADDMANPSNVLAPRVVNYVQKEIKRIVLAEGFIRCFPSAARLVGIVVFSLALVHSIHLLTGRESAAAERFYRASGQYGDAWTMVVGQNNLTGMITACRKNAISAVDAQGRQYCYVPLVLEGVEAQVSKTPAWLQNPTDDSAR